jgi:hypothetical protein
MTLRTFIVAMGFVFFGGFPVIGLTYRDWAAPERALARSANPLEMVESFLAAQERGIVRSFRENLIAKGKTETANRVGVLEELYGGNTAGALQALELLESPSDGFVTQANYVKGLLVLQREFEELASDHFRVRTSTADAFLAPYAVASLENVQARAVEFFGSSPTYSVPIEIYPTVESFSFASTLQRDAMERTGVVSRVAFGRIMLLSPGATAIGYRWLDTMIDAYIHTHVSQVSGGLCPVWLQEGVSRYLEVAWRNPNGFVHNPRDRAVLTQGVLSAEANVVLGFNTLDVPFESLSSMDQVELSRVAVTDAVYFIVQEFGVEKLQSLLHSFRVHSRADAFRLALGVSERDLEKSWREALVERTEVPTELAQGALGPVVRLGTGEDLLLVGDELKVLIRLGDRWRENGANDKAAFEYKKAVKVAPDNGVALTRLAGLYGEMGNLKSADELLTRAIDKNPAYVSSYVLQGTLYFEQGRYEEAQSVLQQALEINPFDPNIYEQLGLIAVDVGNFTLARQSLELALRFDPANTRVKQVLRRMPKGR